MLYFFMSAENAFKKNLLMFLNNTFPLHFCLLVFLFWRLPFHAFLLCTLVYRSHRDYKGLDVWSVSKSGQFRDIKTDRNIPNSTIKHYECIMQLKTRKYTWVGHRHLYTRDYHQRGVLLPLIGYFAIFTTDIIVKFTQLHIHMRTWALPLLQQLKTHHGKGTRHEV